MLMCAYQYPFAHETAGAARTRSSLRPLISGGANILQNFGRLAPRECEGMISQPVIPANAGTHHPWRHKKERPSPPADNEAPRRMGPCVRRDDGRLLRLRSQS